MLPKKKESGIVLLLLLVFFFSCSSSRKTTREKPTEKETPQFDESFDPLKLGDEDIVFKEEKKTADTKESTSPISGAQESADEENKLIDGFRIQLFATKDIESANIAKKEAEIVFTEDSLNIYVEFDTPYYKLRIGDFQDRDNAAQFRDISREKGYQSSWIVKTKVWSNPSLPGKENIRLQN